MSNEQSYEHEIESYGEETAPRRIRTSVKNAQRRTSPAARRSKSPQSVNGLHRRRRRKMSW